MATVTSAGGRKARSKQPAAQPSVPARPPRWEYTEEFLQHGHEWDKALNVYGRDGWELVAMIHDESERQLDQVRCVFKRILVEEPEDTEEQEQEGE